MLLRHGHESVLEHASATVRLITSRTVSHQLVRHRLASPSQESQRYCDYGQGVRFIVPEWFDDVDAEEILKQDKVDTVDDIYNRWVQCRLQDEREYLTYLAAGLKLEQARTCLPNCAATTIVLTANFRELRHIFRLRTSLRADPEMRRSMLPILAEFQSRIPVIFDDVKDRTDG
jgi:thymidylate synthase (FAD)